VPTAIKRSLTPVIVLFLTMCAFAVNAQTGASATNLYEQTSEIAGKIIQYGQDINAIKDFYSPYNVNEHAEDQYKMNVLNSPEQRKRLVEVNNDYLKQLQQTDFESLSIYGKVDFILLKKRIDFELNDLKKEEDKYSQVTKYLSFADDIYLLEKKRRRGDFVDGEKVAAQLNSILKQLKADSAVYSKLPGLDMPLAKITRDALIGLKGRLKDFYGFYNGYDPAFTWWVPVPYKSLDMALLKYSELAKRKGKINTTQKPDSSGIKGVPIGRDALISQLQAEMIPYTPEELIKLANKEFAWCDKEMLKASQEMGFGNDWKKALEKVRTAMCLWAISQN
jgi:hypothetical protein